MVDDDLPQRYLNLILRRARVQSTINLREGIWPLISEIHDLSEWQKRRIQARYMRVLRRDLKQWIEPYAGLSVAAGIWAIVTYFLHILYWRVFQPESDGHALVSTVIGVTCIALAANALTALSLRDNREFASVYARRSDLLFVRLLRIVAMFYRKEDSWHHARTSRQLRYWLLELSRDMSKHRVLLRRTRLHEVRLRMRIKNRNLKIATILRNHADALALAGNQAEYKKVRQSLLAGLIAASEDDWDALLENSDDISALSRLSWLYVRLGPALMLLAAAFTLPLIPAFDGASDTIMSTLIPLAVLSLLGAPEAVFSSIRGVIEKSLSER